MRVEGVLNNNIEYKTLNIKIITHPIVEGVSKMKTKGGEAVQCA